MTLGETVLQRVADWRPPAGRQTLTIPDAGAGWAVTLTADRRDDVGCQVWEFGLSRTEGAATSPRGWADGVAARVTGLLEPLRVVEVDAERREALLRSGTPTPQGESVGYYELLLQGTGAATLRRYKGFPDGRQRREQVPFAVTHEALAKLADDLAAAALAASQV